MKQLLDFIAQPESGGDYNIVWGNIDQSHRPKRPLTEMTIRQVLAWQDGIDPLYRSEAAGKYQILEDTLRGLYRNAGLTLKSKFDEAGQDKLAEALLVRRGYNKYMAGKISSVQFANNLAKEWASLPVIGGPKHGMSYYGGDGLNKSHVSTEAFLVAVEAVGPQSPTKPTIARVRAKNGGLWVALVAIFIAIFGVFKK